MYRLATSRGNPVALCALYRQRQCTDVSVRRHRHEDRRAVWSHADEHLSTVGQRCRFVSSQTPHVELSANQTGVDGDELCVMEGLAVDVVIATLQ